VSDYDARRASPSLQRFMDAVRECLDKEPLYNRPYIPDVERFYMPPARMLDGPTPRTPTT
jgi:hypothetical protein